ncbi:calcium-activated chloride channel-domain-containing protein [Baffinella frigidus]|nr:calcium-activated chloride channel-domain-containing protein [Cryptophyta sp. CCMP2293]
MALYITSFVPDTVHVQFATNGIISMVWFQKLVQAWKRQLAAMEHTWGMEDRDQDATELAFQQAKAHSREHARELALSNLNVDEKMRVRRTRAGLQLVVLGFICILCVITHGITIAFKWVATGGGTEITAGTVVAFSLLDVFRIWGMQAVGGQVLYFLESWDDDIIQDEDRQTWQLAKSLLFDLVNHLCGLFIAVGHKSFAAGTEWVIAPPPCFSVGCREDFEIQIWSIVGLKLMLVPLLISLYEGMAYHRHKVPAATKGIRREFVALSRLMGGGSYPHAGPEAEAVPATGRIEAKASLRRSDSYKAGSSREMGGGKAGGLSKRAGRSGVEEQLLLRHFSRRRWQHRRQLDLLILFAMLTTCATLAPLLPCVVCLWLALKIRLDAHEIVVWTQRGAADRVWGIRFCTMAMSWIAILGIFSNSISIMFITTDIEEVILILGSTYRYYIQKNATFRNIAFGYRKKLI